MTNGDFGPRFEICHEGCRSRNGVEQIHPFDGLLKCISAMNDDV